MTPCSPAVASPAYQDAQAQVCVGADPTEALRLVVETDPSFAPAVADLVALTGGRAGEQPPPRTRWERRHLEIVTTASSDPIRAEVLLREHALQEGCDPIALLVVSRHLDGMDGRRLADLRGAACRCLLTL